MGGGRRGKGEAAWSGGREEGHCPAPHPQFVTHDCRDTPADRPELSPASAPHPVNHTIKKHQIHGGLLRWSMRGCAGRDGR